MKFTFEKDRFQFTPTGIHSNIFFNIRHPLCKQGVGAEAEGSK